MDQLDNILEALKKLSSGEILVTVGVAFEFALRMLKTEKPRSILYIINDVAKKIADICLKVAEVSDKILGQRLKEDPKE